MIDYGKAIFLAVAVSIIFGSGYWAGYSKYVAYKKEVEIAVAAQEAKVESIQKQHELVTKGISDEYDAKLSLIRQYYANGVRSPSTSGLSTPTNATQPTSIEPAHNLLAECAQTTLMLTELQRWYLEVLGVK
jgi:hypothetical protein